MNPMPPARKAIPRFAVHAAVVIGALTLVSAGDDSTTTGAPAAADQAVEKATDANQEAPDNEKNSARKAERGTRALLALFGLCVLAAGLLLLIVLGAHRVRRLVRRPQSPTRHDPLLFLKKALASERRSDDETTTPSGDQEVP